MSEKVVLEFVENIGILTNEDQKKMFIKFKKTRELPKNWKEMIYNYIVLKDRHKKILEGRLKQIKEEITDSFYIINEVEKNCHLAR
jgi:hypothetical protein